jgi:catechol 2,3-dioxygenase
MPALAWANWSSGFKGAFMSSSFSPRLAHVGVSCFDIDKMIDFYTGVFNLRLTDKGPGKTFPFMLAFLSASPSQHHQLALAQNRPAGAPSTVMQLSFKVDTLDDLREARRRALARGASHMRGLNHGNAISIYFVDPEENTVEVYLDTPWYVTQPHGDPLDLEKPDAEIWRETEAIVRADPTFKPVAVWAQDVFG